MEFEQPGIDVALSHGREYRVLAQPQARLTRRLFGPKGVFNSLEELADATQSEATFDSFYGLIAGRAYEVICIFIPNFMPRWEFDGYASETAADTDQYDEEADRSPSLPEIQAMLKAAITVNGLDWLSKLRELIDPKVLRTQLNLTVARMGTGAREQVGLGAPSPSLPPTSGGSDPTSSGVNGATSPAPATSDSLSPASES